MEDKLNILLSIRLSYQEKIDLVNYCNAHKLNVSQFVRNLIQDGIKNTTVKIDINNKTVIDKRTIEI